MKEMQQNVYFYGLSKIFRNFHLMHIPIPVTISRQFIERIQCTATNATNRSVAYVCGEKPSRSANAK